MGRLASVVAKELLNGQRIVLVRTEGINISGSLFRNKMLTEHKYRKRMATNPKKGPVHYKTPSRMAWKMIRGMTPHMTARGSNAMDKLSVFEGCPHPYDKVKKQVIPSALRVTRLKPGRKFCTLGDLAASVGWKHQDLLNRLEAKRTTAGSAYYTTKKELAILKTKAEANTAAELKDVNAKLAQYGY
eukprot:CAMPEP_0175101178 /NCGR_PEP_ID=MMETSP0086_2-20121207/7614_1 /TAXON_ID=136419 /ORGANISM="Unknown Unknown, Strain D1" /LENGTH=186 /DNA_ID=CAMNT_0016375603 /DNA_START=64 /DNA_END=624 /DNA_ORIENTATION=-